MSSLLRNLLIIKHHAPSNMMYSKYQILKILKNCFQNMNCSFRIKLILVLIDLKNWYYHSPHAELPYIPYHLRQVFPEPTESLSNTNLIMFFIGFNILSYSIRPQATTNIGYTKSYIKPNQSNMLSSWIQIVISYGSNALPIKKLSLQELLLLQI